MVLGLVIPPLPGGCFFFVFDAFGVVGVTGAWRSRHSRPQPGNGRIIHQKATRVSIHLRNDYLYTSAVAEY